MRSVLISTKPFIFDLFLVGVTVQSAESLSPAIPLGTSTKRANSKRANHGRSRLFQDAVSSVSSWLRSFLFSDDGHDRCLQCLGIQHTEAAFVDDSCACCGRMSMTSLRSRLSFLKGLAPSAATRPGLSGSSRGPPAGALGDLRVTVRASPPGSSPRTSYSSRSERPVRLPGDFAGSSHGMASISFGAPPEDSMSIAASGDGLTSSEDEGAAGLPPSGVVATAAPDPELTAMLARAAASIGLEVNRPPSPEPSRLDDWFLGAGRGSQPRPTPVPFFPEVHEELTKLWMAPFTARSRLSVSSVLTTLDGGAATCARETPPLGGIVRVSRPKPVSWRLLSQPKIIVLRARQPLPCMPWRSCMFTKPRHLKKCTRVVTTRGWCRSCARRLTSLYERRKSRRGPSGVGVELDSVSMTARLTEESLLPPVEGRVENLMFPFISVPPLAQGSAVPTYSKKEQFPFPPGFQVWGPTVCDALPPHSRPRPILPVAKRARFGDAVPPHAPLASPLWDPGSSAWMLQNALPSVPSSSTPLRCTTAGTSIVPLEPLAWRLEAWFALPSPSRWLTRTIRLGYAIQFARRPPKFSGILETSVAARNAHVLREEIAVLLTKDAIEPVPPAKMRQGFYSPCFIVPKKGGGLRPILDLRLLNQALHSLPFKMLMHRRMIKCIQPRDWFAAIDLKDAYFHVLILPRHRPFLRFVFEGRPWQYRVLPFGLSLSPRVFTKVVEGTLAPLREVGVRILNYLDDWLILAQSREQLCDHRDLVLRHLSQLGLRVNWEKSKLSPAQRISFLGVELDSVSMTACLTEEFLQRQDCGSAETVSEAPGTYGIRSCSHAAWIASYETTSALVALPSPQMGMAPRCTSGEHHTGASPLLQPLDGPCFLRAGVPLEQVSRHVVVTNRCLQHGLGRYMQRAGSLGALDGASTALAHQLPRAAGSASGLAAVSATAVRQACVGPYGQHCGCVVHQPDGRYTITPHVTARPPSLPLESHAAQNAARCPNSGGAQSCSRCALTTAHFPRRMPTPSWDDPADLESIRGSSGRPVCFPRVLPLPAVFLPDRGPPRHGRTGTQLASGSMQVCISPSEPARTDTVEGQGGRGAGPAGWAKTALLTALTSISSVPRMASPGGVPPVPPGSQTGRSSLTPGPVLVLARLGLWSAPVLG